MSPSVQETSSEQITNLQDDNFNKSESLWWESWKRLRKNRAAVIGMIVIFVSIAVAILAPVLAPRRYDKQILTDNNAAPNWVISIFPNLVPKEDGGYVNVNNDYILGADGLGRDLLSRIIYGARVSLAVAFIGPLTSLLIGMIVGLVAGYLGGWLDNVLMRVVDLMYAFPTLLFVILLMSFFRTSFAHPKEGTIAYTLGNLDASTGGMLFIFIGIGLTSWMQMARIVRAQVLSIREKEYIEAAVSIGMSGVVLRYSR